MSQLKIRLAAVWENYAPKRYVPRAINGGPAWEVWDVAQERYLKNAELLAVPLDAVKTETIMIDAALGDK